MQKQAILSILVSILVSILALVLGLAPSVAIANPDDPSRNRSGWYVGITGLYGADTFSSSVGSIEVEDTGGLNLYAGYRATSWFAAEANYEWMDNFRTRLGSGISFDYATHSFTANAKFILPLWRAQPYLNLGIGGQYYDSDIPSALGSATGWGFVGRPGAGVDFFVTENWVLNAQVNGMLSTTEFSTLGRKLTDLFYVSIGAGIQYRF